MIVVNIILENVLFKLFDTRSYFQPVFFIPLIDWPNKIYLGVSPTVVHLFGKK